MDLAHWQKSSLKEFNINQPQPTQQQGVMQQGVPGQLIRRVSKRNVGIKKSLASAGGQIFETFEPQQKGQTQIDIQFIIKCFQSHFVFSAMSESHLAQLAKSMFYCRLTTGQTIIKQGDSASSFFILEKGKINVIVDGVMRKELTSGSGFGELALLYNAPRSATCVAAEECFLWGIDRHTFRKSIEQIMSIEQEKNRKYIEKVKFFNQLTREQNDAIAGVLISQKFGKGEVIVNEGDQASSFYIIVEGQCGVFTKEGQQIAVLNPNDSFGESALKQENQVRMMTIKAILPDTKVLALGKDMVQQILGDQVQSIIYKNICKWALHASKYFNMLSQATQDKLLEGVTFKKVKANETILKKGDQVGQLIVLLENNAIDDTKKQVALKSGILAEDTLSDKSRGLSHQSTYYSEGDGTIAIVDYEAFRKQQGSVEQILQGQQQSTIGNQQLRNQLQKYTLKELVYLNKLGSGQFGSVYLCKFKDNDTLMALKYVTRAHIQQFGIQKHVQQEKAVLELMDHDFILKFYRSFKDNENIYFLTEFIPGMELFDAIRVIGLLQKYDAQFYAAQMILQMEYLHTVHQIVYRDIKPENIMVDDKGYLKLIDMGTAKSFKNSTSTKTFTIIGTPHYMAPEVISGKGYGYHADLWSVGVCLYEFICGGLPFGEEAEDPFEIYKEIIKKPITYPHYMTDKTAKPIIEQLMNKIPEIRLGGSYASLRGHMWFKDLNWDQLTAKKLKAPILPGKDKVMSSEQIRQAAAKNVSVVDQIQKDTAGQKKVLASAKDADWDSAF